jgi:hypothetical protein
MISCLQKMCIDTIINRDDFYNIDLYQQLPYHLAEEIYREKHRKLMSKTLLYFDRINKTLNVSNNQTGDIMLSSIKYLVGEDFFSYDHLLVRYKFKNTNTFTFSFIQM